MKSQTQKENENTYYNKYIRMKLIFFDKKNWVEGATRVTFLSGRDHSNTLSTGSRENW